MSSDAPSLSELENREDFRRRHVGPGPQDEAEMLKAVGLDTLDDLIDKAVPRTIESDTPMDLPPAMTEAEALARLADIAGRNQIRRSFIGMGYHGTHTPSVIRRNIIENPGWYTAYTPYQPEISQGRLEALVNFQQAIMDLTAMPVANASLLDEASAAAEAMTLLHRGDKSKRGAFFVDADCHPQTLAVVETRAAPLGIEVLVGDPRADMDPEACFGALLQYPASDGTLHDDRAMIAKAREAGCRVAVAADLLALALIVPPGEMGADIVLGSAQRFGVPLGFGGPHAAYFACQEEYRRSIPGRIVGVSVDANDRPAMRLALQTREQHIRREKATSNICTAQVLLAVIAGFYAVYHGPDGIRRIAQRVHRLTSILAAGLARLGCKPDTDSFFDTLTLDTGPDVDAIAERLDAAGINVRRYSGSSLMGISLDETATRADVEAIWQAFAGDKPVDFDVAALDGEVEDGIPAGLRRDSEYLTHPVFNSYHSETEMMRYLRRLADKDIALNRSMIPLGSCTMKLNAATEMLPITWPEFANIHPFAPAEQTQGYGELIGELESMLQAVTGFDSVSLQPNSGAQGEYAGLLTIRAYHASRGDEGRNICLIPSSAHGTNPASAVMAGMKVVVVNCDDQGNVDVEDLKAKAKEHSDKLGALMVTYPSTHGVFEEAIRDICATVHEHGGQVYMDGANLNALLGLAKPAEFGADVMHMNLHKTFCIPHGGGGPGVGPIGCREHLTPFRPNHPLAEQAGPKDGFGPVAAAPWGSAGILPISWAYIAMMGAEGLTQATRAAILNANYLAKRLSDHYPILYTGKGGLVAHECIVDTRVLKDEAGISVDDVAKRLMDFGFHAPTMSWPVAGTLMIEPTESESKAELDRFCEAMIAIRKEAKKVARGDWPKDDNPLVNAPHTQETVTAEKWEHAYSREVAAYPTPAARYDKYWPPVARVDNVYGDRHLVCSCPSIEEYRSAAE